MAQIITFGTLKARAAIRDVGRVMDVPLQKVDKIAKLIRITSYNVCYTKLLRLTLIDIIIQDTNLNQYYFVM